MKLTQAQAAADEGTAMPECLVTIGQLALRSDADHEKLMNDMFLYSRRSRRTEVGALERGIFVLLPLEARAGWALNQLSSYGPEK